MPNLNRRNFLKTSATGMGSLVTASSHLSTLPIATGGDKARQDHGMVFWLAHSFFPAGRAGRAIDEKLVAEVMANCRDHGFTTVYVQPRYVGKAVYHSKVVSQFDTMYGGVDRLTL